MPMPEKTILAENKMTRKIRDVGILLLSLLAAIMGDAISQS